MLRPSASLYVWARDARERDVPALFHVLARRWQPVVRGLGDGSRRELSPMDAAMERMKSRSASRWTPWLWSK